MSPFISGNVFVTVLLNTNKIRMHESDLVLKYLKLKLYSFKCFQKVGIIFFFIIPDSVIKLFGSIFETPFSRSAGQTDIKTDINTHITISYR